MIIEVNGFALDVSLHAARPGGFVPLPLEKTDGGLRAAAFGMKAELTLGPPSREGDRIPYGLSFTAPFRTRLRLRVALRDETEPFHLIPGNIHGDNNAAHVRPGTIGVGK